MNYWIITDTHFGHDKMSEYCGRPKNFENIIFKHLQNCIKDDDVLIHLGDICIYNDEEWHKIFCGVANCKWWLIRGNHDKKTLGWYLSHGWDFVADEITLQIFGKRVALSHKPITIHDNFDLNIHGHHHNTGHHPEDQVTDKHRLVFLEHSYMPINLRRLVEFTPQPTRPLSELADQ